MTLTEWNPGYLVRYLCTGGDLRWSFRTSMKISFLLVKFCPSLLAVIVVVVVVFVVVVVVVVVVGCTTSVDPSFCCVGHAGVPPVPVPGHRHHDGHRGHQAAVTQLWLHRRGQDHAQVYFCYCYTPLWPWATGTHFALLWSKVSFCKKKNYFSSNKLTRFLIFKITWAVSPFCITVYFFVLLD